jgi:hypothetical protein
MILQGEGVQTCIVCGYSPCVNNRPNSRTSYQQCRMTKWQDKEDRLVVYMDTNKDIYKKSLGHSLTNQEGLNMMEVVGEFTGKKLGTTFFQGTKPIDGVWATDDLTIMHACVMPTRYGV